MADRIAQSFLNELADIEREIAIGDYYDLKKDVALLVQAILSYAASALDVPGLDAKAQASEAIDVANLRSAVEALDNETVLNARVDLPGGHEPLVAKDDLALTKVMLKGVEDAAQGHHRFETGARLELGLSHPFFRIQIELANQPDALGDLDRRVRGKIALLKEEDVRRLWGTLTEEFRARESNLGAPPMPVDRDVLGPDFFDPKTVEEIRERLATYAVRLKPLLVRKMFESGVSSYRAGFPSVPQFLALREIEPLTLQERRILECLLKIYRVWGHEHEDEFAGALGVKAPHWPQRAAKLDRTLLRYEKNASSESKRKILLLALRRLLNYTESFVGLDSSVERALVQYKLGLEVMLPGSRKTVAGQGELDLQKELCRFLIERDIRAFGKLFGRSEVDLLAEIPGERFLIETKVLKKTSPRSIDRNVTQLISYLDQEEPATRGVLVLYNVSDTTIVAERRWFRQRLWILPVNLCVTSPSKTKKRLNIEDGGTAAMLRFFPSLDEVLSNSKPRAARRR